MKIFRSEAGAVVVMVALLMVSLLGFLALIVDVGFLYLAQVRLEDALDAVVLAGVQNLPDNPDLARDTALNYANKNKLPTDNLTIEIKDSNHQITAQSSKQVDMRFATVLGIDQIEVGATSGAKVGQITAITGAVPFGVVNQNFAYGQKYYLKYGAGGPAHANGRNGNFGALALGGQGASNYEDNLENGYDNELQIGEQVTTEPGNMAGPTRRGVQSRLNDCQELTPCTYDSVEKGCSRLAFVPVIDELGNGRTEATVVGFAAFFLEGLSSGDDDDNGKKKDKGKGKGNGKTSYVEGRFINWIAESGKMGSTGNDFNLRTTKLIE